MHHQWQWQQKDISWKGVIGLPKVYSCVSFRDTESSIQPYARLFAQHLVCSPSYVEEHPLCGSRVLASSQESRSRIFIYQRLSFRQHNKRKGNYTAPSFPRCCFAFVSWLCLHALRLSLVS